MKDRWILWIKITAIVLILLLIPLQYGAGEEIGPDMLLSGRYASPFTISITDPSYKHIAQFGEERTSCLNKVLSHLTLSVSVDGKLSETTLMVDQEPLYSIDEEDTDTVRKTVYSFDPDTVYEQNTKKTEEDMSFPFFLENHFFSLNRMLDDLYPLFEKTADAFQEFAKPSAASLSFRGYGKGVRKIQISLSDQYVSDHFPYALSALACTEESRLFIEKLIFKGAQKIVLLYDQEDKLLRINYDGTVGLEENSMRRVSLAWRCVRSDDVKKDNLSLKTPAQKGTDRYNISYERETDLSDPDHHKIKWDLQIDLKTEQKKQKISSNADLMFSEQKLTGQIVFSDKQENEEKEITITPSLQKENDSEYAGTIEITNNSGKIVLSSIAASVRIASGNPLHFPETQDLQLIKVADDDQASVMDRLSDMQNRILIRRLLSLPTEDLAFFSMDIPKDVWQTLMQTLI